MAPIDYVILAAYFVFLLALGPIFNRFNRSASDYFRAGGAMVWWIAGTAIVMGGFSAWAFTGGAARVYETGLFFLALFAANFIGDIVTYFFLAAKFRQMRVVTVAEAIRKRFGPVNEQVFTWIQVPLRLLYAGIGLYTLAVFASGAFGLNMVQLVIVLGAAVTVMSVSGGSWAINAGQFVQAVLFLCITGIMVFATLAHPQVGGITGLVKQLPAAHFDWTGFERPSILAIFIGTLVLNQVIQRNALQEGAAKFLIVKNGRDARRVTLLGMVCILILTPMWMIPAMGSVIVHPNLGDAYSLNNPNEAAYVAMAQATLPPGLVGLLICAIFSASLDALSSGVNTVAAVLVRNFYLPVLNPATSERKQVWIGRALSALGGLLMVVVALLLSRGTTMPLYTLVITIAAAVGLPQAVPLFLGIFVRRAPSVSLWSTLAVGFACSLVMTFVVTDALLNRVWGSETTPLSRFEINDLRVAVITAVLLVVCVGWFFLCTIVGRRVDSARRNAEVDAFFAEMNTPIDDALEHAGEGYESDARQYRVVGALGLTFGGFVAAMAALPNTPAGRLGLLFCGGTIAAVGGVLVLIARRGSSVEPRPAAPSDAARVSGGRVLKRSLRVTAALVLSLVAFARADVVDSVRFGDDRSEKAHQVVPTRSETIKGGLEEPARQLLPLDPPGPDGGKVAFTLKVHPKQPTYFTLKAWGSDSGEERGRLLLFCEGKQVGVRHLGDVDACIDILSNEPRFPGRFTYTTTVLPMAMTADKQAVTLEIRSLGRIWVYGETWERFQKNLEQPSRGIYAAYTHTQPQFVPPADEKQGAAPKDAPARTAPGPEVLDEIKARVNKEIANLLAAPRLNQMHMQLLAKGYRVKWTPAYQNEEVVKKIVDGLDALYVAHTKDPKLMRWDPATPNPDWFGFGPAGDAIRLLSAEITPHLDDARRANWTAMLLAARDWHRANRRLYTNQSMIKDLYGIYLANRAVAVLDPAKAMPEAEARRYLYESVGLQPWLGSDTPNSPAKPMGENYLQLTDRGLTKELGYVGSYGEVLDWMASIYEATRPAHGQPGDERIRQQLVKAARARGNFRYPLLDRDGFHTMVLEQTVGWRDHHYPGYVTYAQRPTRDAGPFEVAVATMDPHLVGYARQLIEDGQLFVSMREVMRETSFRVTAGLIGTPEQYEIIKSQKTSPHRLPMTPGQPDFVFADEEDGVVALKNREEILYASLYWRARFGINSLARVHHITPTIERDATVWQDVRFDDSGLTTRRNDRVMEAQTRRHEKSRGDVRQALEGDVLPIAKVPPGVKFKPGEENIYAGKGTFYTLRYGPYLIAMNCTTDRTFELRVPEEMRGAKVLTGGGFADGDAARKVGPRSTVVLWKGLE